jgi:pimeloyl-ACP methyl ester carboxylesterase
VTLTAAAPAGAVTLVRMLVRVACAVAIAFAVIGWASPRDAAAGPLPDGTTMQERLAELGGEPCPTEPRLTCVTLTVPLDHFDASDPRTLDVVFGVLPASGTSKGVFVIATGGPGSAGISEFDSWIPYFAASIPRRFDIVLFDQRGIGLSGGLTCPDAAAAYYGSDAAPASAAEVFSAACVAEMGSQATLPFVGTDQAVEDLEAFRQAVGMPRMWLYGVSYGTQYAQTYAAAHGDALSGLVIDGVVDLTLTGPEFWEDAAGSFERVLDRTLASCDRRLRCRKDGRLTAGRTAADVYEEVSAGPVTVRFPLPSGGSTDRELTHADLVTAAGGQVYTESDRMMLQRAIAAAGRGDLVPLLRLAYVNLVVDPQTLAAIPDPSYSDGMYYGVDCQDYAYFQGTPDERAEQYVAAAAPIRARYPRIGEDTFLSDLPCAFWPSSREDPARPAPLTAEGVPTIVLTSTDDPITPTGQGEAVFRRLDDGYLITTQGGPHGTFAWGNACPDDQVTRFLANDVVPTARESTCPGRLADAYVPLAPERAAAFKNARSALASAETEISYLPEYYYWDGITPTSVGCPVGGGTMRIRESANGARFVFRRCGFTRGVVMTGRGSYDFGRNRFVLDVTLSGRFDGHFRYVRN